MALTALTFSMLGFIIGIWADNFEKTTDSALADYHPADLPGRQLLLNQYAAGILAKSDLV